MLPRWLAFMSAWVLVHTGRTASRQTAHSRASLVRRSKHVVQFCLYHRHIKPRRLQQLRTDGILEPRHGLLTSTEHKCTGTGHYGLLCTFHDLVLWQKQFHYISTEDVSIPEVREGWHMWWHPYGEAMLPDHIKVIHPSSLPWAPDSPTEHLEQALIYNWLDQANMYHVMMETGNFIYATACKLLGACTHATSHYQILSTGYFNYGDDNGLPAGHESLACLSSKMPRWVGDTFWDDKVVVIGTTAVGVGVQCDDPQCEWDSVPFMQRSYTSGHRQLMLDCLGIEDQGPPASQQQNKVTIVQRAMVSGRSMLNVLEVQEAVADMGAQVKIVSLEGKTLKEQAKAVAGSHIYILIHGAAMAMLLFLPKHAAIIEVQHYYANSSSFPANLYQRTVLQYNMDYHHEIYVSPRPLDMSLQHDRVLHDPVYQTLTAEQQLLLWEQGMCPSSEDELMSHCVTKWVFTAHMVIDLDELKRVYRKAWQSLPPGSLLTSSH